MKFIILNYNPVTHSLHFDFEISMRMSFDAVEISGLNAHLKFPFCNQIQIQNRKPFIN